MSRLHEPNCVAEELGTGLICGRPMDVLGERDPSFGPNYRPGSVVFRCRRCGAIRAIDKLMLERYLERK